MVDTAFDRADLLRSDVRGVGLKTTWLDDRVRGDVTKVFIEDSHQASVMANPHVAAQVFWRHTVKRSVDRNVSVARNLSLGFVIELEPGQWKLGKRWQR